MNEHSEITFFKLSATGNDFILIDNRQNLVSGLDKGYFRQICQRRTSVGADGVLLIEKCPEYDFRMRYFNADGSEAACGNGARSAAYFACKKGLAGQRLSFMVENESYEAYVKGNIVKLKMPAARDLSQSVGVVEENGFKEGGFINTGVPHYVLFGNDIDEIDVYNLGRKYRLHSKFHPEGTNVNFAEVLSENKIKLRTYERGVENETLSCGTGCVASAYLANIQNKTRFPTEILTRGGKLRILRDEHSERLYLEAEVKLVYEGKLIMDRR